MAISSGIVTPTASTSPLVMSTPPMAKSSCCEWIRSGMPCCEPPRQSRPTFCRMKEKPTAVISGASFGALTQRPVRDPLDHRVEHARSRASRPTSVMSRPRTSSAGPVSCVSPIVVKKPAEMNEPIMNTSPWAKLISSTMP